MPRSATLSRMFWGILLATILCMSYQKPSVAQVTEAPCRSGRSEGTRILLGRFLTVGSSSDAAMVEAVLQAEIGAYLRGQPRAVLFGASPTRPQESEKALASLIESVFSQGPQGDAAAQRVRSVLSSELQSRGCEYVIGGEVNAGNLYIVTPYLFDARTATLEIPIQPVVGTDLARSARELAARLWQKLTDRESPKEGIRTSLLVGCFSSPNMKDRDQTETIARAITKAVSSEISGDPTYPALRPLGSSCNDLLATSDDRTRTIIFTGDVDSAASRKALSPRFWIAEPQRSQAAVRLERILETDSLENVIRQYANEVRTFAVAFGGAGIESSSLEPLWQLQQAAALDVLGAQFDTLLNQARYTDAFALSYRAISDNLDSPSVIALSRFTIARALLKRSETTLALSQLIKAYASQDSLPPLLRAQLNETLGTTYAALGTLPSAITRLEDAATLYDGLGLAPQNAKVRKAIAGARIKLGDLKRAKNDLLSVPDLSNDLEALLLLSRVSLSLGDFEGNQGAQRWVGDALKVRPDSSEARNAAKETYAAIGQRALQDKKAMTAERAFRSSLEIEENTQYRYLAGYSAYTNGAYDRAIDDFGRIVDGTSSSPYHWTEAAWLTRIECYILIGNYAEADRQGERAMETAFASVPDSRLVALYLRTVARALIDPAQDALFLERDSVYQQALVGVPNQKLRLDWDNGALSSYYKRILKGNPEKLRKLTDLAKQLFLMPMKG